MSAARADHREWIGGRAFTLLSHYWRDDDPAELTAAIGADWADVLEDLDQEDIQRACLQYQREEPRKKPTAGAIRALALSMRPQKPRGEFSADREMERRILERLKMAYEIGKVGDFSHWPRDELQYFNEARGGTDCTRWMDEKLGWYRRGGPNEERIRLGIGGWGGMK